MIGVTISPFAIHPPSGNGVSINAALSMWRDWNVDVPPTGVTGNPVADKRLADAFRTLAALKTRDERFAAIEHWVWMRHDFPPPGAVTDPYRATLLRWWLEIFEGGAP